MKRSELENSVEEVLTPRVYEALTSSRTPFSTILSMAGKTCFLHPHLVGAEATCRIREALLMLEDPGHFDFEPE